MWVESLKVLLEDGIFTQRKIPLIDKSGGSRKRQGNPFISDEGLNLWKEGGKGELYVVVQL